MTTSNVVQMSTRPACGVDWCDREEPDHEWHYSAPRGAETRDEGEVVSAAVARRVRLIGADSVEVLVFDLDEGGQTTLLSPDEADELARALTALARECRNTRKVAR